MRILLAHDGSDGADTALSLVDALSWGEGAALRVVTISEAVVMVAGIPFVPASTVPPPRVLDEIEQWHEDIIARATAQLQGAGRIVEGAVIDGRAATAILDDAQSWKADLIVTGSRGHGTVTSLLLGSVSSEIIDGSPSPVLIARTTGVRRVVFATDGSESSAAAEETLSWPIFDEAEIRVVSIADVSPPWRIGVEPTIYEVAFETYRDDLTEAQSRHGRLAEDAAARLRSNGRQATVEVRTGDPAAEILNAADAWSADLVVMGSRGQTGLKRMLLGSVARNVLQGASASVMIARAADAPR